MAIDTHYAHDLGRRWLSMWSPSRRLAADRKRNVWRDRYEISENQKPDSHDLYHVSASKSRGLFSKRSNPQKIPLVGYLDFPNPSHGPGIIVRRSRDVVFSRERPWFILSRVPTCSGLRLSAPVPGIIADLGSDYLRL